MMNYYYHGYGNYGNWGPMMGGDPGFLWPFLIVGTALAAVLALVWLVVTIWALIDLFKHKPPHTVAWAFVIILGKIMGPIGYYFIVVKDRMKQ